MLRSRCGDGIYASLSGRDEHISSHCTKVAKPPEYAKLNVSNAFDRAHTVKNLSISGLKRRFLDIDGELLSSAYVHIAGVFRIYRTFSRWQAVCIELCAMDPLTSAAANGLQASMDSFDMLANNLANSSTSGFKADREFYSTYLAQEADDQLNPTVGVSPVVQKQWTDFAQGTLVNTGNNTDLALSGTGFFAVNGPSGTLYTRGGNFHVSPKGQLVTSEGYPVRLAGNQTLQLQSPSPLQVGSDGQVMQDGNPLGQLELVTFKDNTQLGRSAGVYFQNQNEKENPAATSTAQVFQGKSEASNATPADSAARMISLMRHFEMLQHAVKLGTDMNRQAIEEVARVGS
jgi:flagellar basal-body rod protein FlgF